MEIWTPSPELDYPNPVNLRQFIKVGRKTAQIMKLISTVVGGMWNLKKNLDWVENWLEENKKHKEDENTVQALIRAADYEVRSYGKDRNLEAFPKADPDDYGTKLLWAVTEMKFIMRILEGLVDDETSTTAAKNAFKTTLSKGHERIGEKHAALMKTSFNTTTSFFAPSRESMLQTLAGGKGKDTKHVVEQLKLIIPSANKVMKTVYDEWEKYGVTAYESDELFNAVRGKA